MLLDVFQFTWFSIYFWSCCKSEYKSETTEINVTKVPIEQVAAENPLVIRDTPKCSGGGGGGCVKLIIRIQQSIAYIMEEAQTENREI